MVPYLGDFAEDATVYMPFNTFDSNDPAASVTITDLVAGDVHIHKDGSTTQKTTSNGITVSIDFDTITGNHLISIDTSNDTGDAGFWVTGSDYHVRVEGTTVDAGTINAWIGHFSIQNRYSAGALRPTTAGRTLDVSATGEAGIDWANIGSPTTAQNLSGTNIDVDQVVASVSGNVDGSVGSVTGAVGSVTGAVGSVTAAVTVGTINANVVNASALATDAVNEIVDQVWDEAQADHVAAGSMGLIASEVADILVDTAEIGAAGAGLTNINLPDQTMNITGNLSGSVGSVTGAVGSVTGAVGSVAGNVDGNVSGSVADVLAISGSAATANNLETLFDGNEGFYSAYSGPCGPGVYLNDAAANTNTANGVDGTVGNPVSTIAAAKTLADSMSLDRIYLVNDSSITLAATMVDYEFVGIGEITANVIDLGSQDVSNSTFYNVAIQGTQGGSGRILARDCALQDPGAGDTTLHIFACRCGIVDRIQIDTSNDNVFDACYSLVAGASAPIIQATGAAGTVAVRHYSGGIEFESLSASHNVSVETDGQVIFAASCNVNANVSLRGNMTITDNTAGMASLTQEAVFNRAAINAEADTAISDAALATAAALATVDSNVDAILLDTAELQGDWADGGRLDLILDARAAEATVAALNDISVADILTTQMTESYNADGTAPTLAQALFMILQQAGEFSISGTTITVKQLDGTTTAATFTLDSATNPTSRTRAT